MRLHSFNTSYRSAGFLASRILTAESWVKNEGIFRRQPEHYLWEEGVDVKRTYTLLAAVALFWAGAFHTGRDAVQMASPFLTATVRFGLAGILLLLILAIREKLDWHTLRKHWLGLALLGMTGIFAYNAFFFVGLQSTSAVNGALVIAVNPVVTLLMSALILRETVGWKQILGFLLSLSGVLLVISNGSWDVIRDIKFQTGDILLLGAVASWVAYSILGKRMMQHVSPLTATAWSTVLGTIALAVVTMAQNGFGQMMTVSARVWADWMYMAVFATVLGFLWWNQGVQQAGAARASIFINLVPIFTLLIAVVIGQPVSWVHGAGAMMVIGGVLLATQVSLAKNRARTIP